MNRQKLLTIGLALVATSAAADWQPTFVDNFDGNEVDKSAWVPGREILPRRIQYYDADAASVVNGKLRMSVLDRAESDRPYTAATVTTQGIFKQQFGYFEMRAKVPAGKGYWPAFWLMPESGRWTSEIDISEFRGHLTDTVHYGFHYGFSLQNQNGLTAPLPIDAADSFNNYAVHWTPERIDYLFNGQVMHSVTDAASVANADSEMFVILNVALASQHSGWIPTIDADTDLSGDYEIDYVRVYTEVPSGPYASIPAPTTPVADVRVTAYDNTALDVDRIGEGPGTDIMRTPGPISGALKLTAHKADYNGQVSVVLTQMSNFNNSDGRYDKSAALETRNFNISMDTLGETQTINYAFDTIISSPSAYSVDVIVKDFTTNNKKSLATHRVVQYVDSTQTQTTAFFEGFFRTGVASYANDQVNTTLQVQLQQAMLTPHLNVTYELVDAYADEVLFTQTATVEHDQVGLIELSAAMATTLDTELSVGLIAEVTDASGGFSIARYGIHVAGTAPLPDGWTPDSGPITPPIGGGTIPLQNWTATFVDNFDGNALNASSWIPNRDQLPRRLQHYDKDSLSVNDGHLEIKVLNRPESDRPYTSGTISTQGLFKQQYGYFEIRASIPKGNGFWPAFWLMPESGQWTSEIDIAEFRGQLPETVHHAYHYGFRLRNENGKTVQLGGDLSNSYNNFAVYWTPERIDFLFNGIIVHSLTDAEAIANANSDMYLILNLALSSQHASEWIPVVDESTDFAETFSIDYVRVYEPDPNGEHVGIPVAQSVIGDLAGVAYDNTALEIDRVASSIESDILRTPGQIRGQFKATSHKDNYSGLVSVMLVPILEFNPSDGRFTKGATLDVQNLTIDLANAGDSTLIDYVFDPVVATPGAYSVDFVVRDTATNNKRSYAGHRFVQYVDATIPDTTVFFEGYVRHLAATYENGQVNARATIQMQQAMLAPAIEVTFEVVEPQSESVIASTSQIIEHDRVGQMFSRQSIDIALEPTKNYDLRVRVNDLSGAFVLSEYLGQIAGVGDVALPTPPHLPIDGPVTPVQLPPTQPVQPQTAPALRRIDPNAPRIDVVTHDKN